MPRKLRPEEKKLWQSVADQAVPLRRGVLAMPHVPKVDQPMERKTGSAKIAEFAIGSKKTPLPISQGFKPAPNMDAKTFSKMSRGKLKPEASLDLHGMTVVEAHPELIDFISRCAMRQMRLVLVVTGKGKDRGGLGPIPERIGVLRQSLPNWLRSPSIAHLILDSCPAHQRHGGAGATYIYLRRHRT
ncbi:MAG: Smr/MutS family protein [Planktomarina sp.]